MRALGWDHPRCRAPMTACAARWNAEHPEAPVEWSFRSLTAFGDQPIEDAARDFDLVVIDHPFCGRAMETACLLPLDELVPAETLAGLAADAVGPSHDSYAYAGHQWGLATDAACQLSAFRPGFEPPETWEDAPALARRSGSALPLSPPHAISSFLTLCAGGVAANEERLVEDEVGERAWATLSAFYACGPAEALGWEPPETLARLAAGELDYVPITYGYVTYASACRFAPVPGLRGGVLGGAGLAVSAASAEPAQAAAFGVWASSGEVQRTIVAPAGGQPGSRSAWLDGSAFYSDTLAAHEAAWTRPRDPWWPRFQLAAGQLLVEALANGTASTVDRLNTLYRAHRNGA
jgi:multiple sugar transport system substrate-binding protein